MNMLNQDIIRIEKINKFWEDIHDICFPYFYWKNHSPMQYEYNNVTDTIDCECGISIPINVSTEDLTEDILVRLIDELEYKIYKEYKEKKNINLGYSPYAF